jgi:hypothetical protein
MRRLAWSPCSTSRSRIVKLLWLDLSKFRAGPPMIRASVSLKVRLNDAPSLMKSWRNMLRLNRAS